MARRYTDFFLDEEPPKGDKKLPTLPEYEQPVAAQDNTKIKQEQDPIQKQKIVNRANAINSAPKEPPQLNPDNRTTPEKQRSEEWVNSVNKNSIPNTFTDIGTYLASAGTAKREEYLQNRAIANNPHINFFDKVDKHSDYIYNNIDKPALAIGTAEFLAIGNGFLSAPLRSAMIEGAKANTILDIKQSIEIIKKIRSGEKVSATELGLAIASVAARTGNTDFSTFVSKLQNGNITGDDILDISQDIIGLTTNALERSVATFNKGQIYDLSQSEIDTIIANGGEVEYLNE